MNFNFIYDKRRENPYIQSDNNDYSDSEEAVDTSNVINKFLYEEFIEKLNYVMTHCLL